MRRHRLAFLIGFISAASLRPSGYSVDTMRFVSGVPGRIGSLIVGLFVVRATLRKQYRNFHLKLLPNE